MYTMKTSSNRPQSQHSSTPAQDLLAVAAVLQALPEQEPAAQQDTLARIIVTLRGLADEIDGLVRPGSEED